MRIHLLSSAYDDLIAGRDFYETQSNELGEYFFDSLFSDIDSLVLYAGVHLKIYGYHRLLSKRFPYAIYYTMSKDKKQLPSTAFWTVVTYLNPSKLRY